MFWKPTLLLIISEILAVSTKSPYDERNWWYNKARASLDEKIARNTVGGKLEKAKNVVLLIGDGMGLTTLTAARIFKGQKMGKSGEEYELAWEKFPAVALAKTYNLDAQVGESSACATALLCGVKANFETVGLDGNGKFENCFSSYASRVDSLIDWAQQEGKSTGIVTNTRITHATPAALYSHSPSRYWEDDGKVAQISRKSCKDIARQLVEDDPGRYINVLLGGGRRHWLPKAINDPEFKQEEGRRLDGRNLIDDWLRDKKKRGIRGEYVWRKSQLEEINPSAVDHLLGGRIDHAHHFNNPHRALEETLVLETALLSVLSSVNLKETLVVVTADHSHVLTLGGLTTPRGNKILGVDSRMSDVDQMPYSTLLYGNGPGFDVPRPVPTNLSVNDKNAIHGAAAPRKWATHGGEDVPVYATGPSSSILFSGTVDQSYIPHAIAYASCFHNYKERCDPNVTKVAEKIQNCTLKANPSLPPPPRSGNPAVVLASSVMSEEEEFGKTSRGMQRSYFPLTFHIFSLFLQRTFFHF